MPPMAFQNPHGRNLRKGRYSQVGCFYFLTTSVAGRRRLFTEKDRANIVLDAIRWLHAADRFMVDAAVVMPDHLHVVGQLGSGSRLEAAPTVGDGNSLRLEAAPTIGDGHSSRLQAAPTLAKIMHTLKSCSAKRLARTGISTPVWQHGYHDHELRDDEDYRSRVQYVVQNPLRAGLVTRVEDYPYLILPDWWTGV
ncbi:MAG: hypothetical protein GY783_05165 [Gammaproteobacteria bacterium]|nr:hypothetical protein [Gammaproteobacteria bacterium]